MGSRPVTVHAKGGRLHRPKTRTGKVQGPPHNLSHQHISQTKRLRALAAAAKNMQERYGINDPLSLSNNPMPSAIHEDVMQKLSKSVS